MKEKIIEYIITNFGFLPPELIVILISALPILELRGGLPIAFAYFHFPIEKAMILSILGNLLPVIPLLILFQPTSRWFLRFAWYEKMYNWLYNRTVKKSDQVEKYGAIGLLLFTAVPLPTTGAYSACVAACIFAIRFEYAFLSIAAGILVSAGGIALLTYSIW